MPLQLRNGLTAVMEGAAAPPPLQVISKKPFRRAIKRTYANHERMAIEKKDNGRKMMMTKGNVVVYEGKMLGDLSKTFFCKKKQQMF